MMWKRKAFSTDWYHVFWYFVLYCVFGVMIEVIFNLVVCGFFESRQGLLYGPFNPIYGIGATVMIVCLRPLYRKPLALFFAGVLIGSAVEYLGSVFMEAAFGAVWWDYSNLPLNLNGRICLGYSIGWGLLGVVLMYVLNPWMDKLISRLRGTFWHGMTWFLLAYMLCNVTITFSALYNLNTRIHNVTAVETGEALRPLPPGTKLLLKIAPDSYVAWVFPGMNNVKEMKRLELEGRWVKDPQRQLDGSEK